MSSPIITAKNLSTKFKMHLIWDNANFEINKGEYVGILGPNGAGKTTLIKLLLGLLEPSEGSLKLFGKKPSKGNPKIGYVPQRHPVDRDNNIAAIELVKLGINGTKWGWQSVSSSNNDKDIALKALEEVDGLGLANKPLGILSGGELQRVFLAQALIGKPDLLLLDEPLANLDIKHEVNLIQLIDRVVKTQGVTVLLIAHDINPLLPVMDKIIYVANGHVSSGKPSKIITSKALSELYGTPIEVLKDSRGRVAIIGTEESSHPHA